MTIEEAIIKYPEGIKFIPKGSTWKDFPCELFPDTISSQGYGFIWDNSKRQYILAHRFIYKRVRGTISIFQQIDHLCRNRACINPFHLEAVSPRENIRRGNNHVAKKMASTHCKNGHELNKENCVAWCFPKKRLCKICINTKKRNTRGYK